MITTKHLKRWGLLLAFIVVLLGAYQIPVSVAADEEPVTVVSTETYQEANGTEVTETQYSDGSGDASVMVPLDTDNAARYNLCGPQVTQDDLERYVDAGGPAGGPTPTGDDPCDGVARSQRARASSGRLPDYDCTGRRNFSDNDVHAVFCVGYRIKENGPTLVWSSKGVSSAWSNDGFHGDECRLCDRVTRFSTYQKWENGWKRDWAPAESFHPGECWTKTLSVSYSGQGSSFAVPVCPETYGPWAIGDHSSGARFEKPTWGVPLKEYRSAKFLQMASSGAYRPDGTIRFYIRWNNRFG